MAFQQGDTTKTAHRGEGSSTKIEKIKSRKPGKMMPSQPKEKKAMVGSFEMISVCHFFRRGTSCDEFFKTLDASEERLSER